MVINADLLHRFALKLQHHAKADEWDVVRKLDKQLFKLLANFKENPELAQSLKSELIALKKVHLAAMTACEAEKDRIGLVLSNYQQQREGVSAYSTVESGGML